MGLGGILQELKREGVLALYHDYRSGRLADLSGNGNNGVVSGSGFFTKDGVEIVGPASVIQVTHTPSLVFTSCTLIIARNLYKFDTSYQYERLMSKRGAGGGNVQFEWYNNNSPTSNAISGSATTAVSPTLPNIINRRTDAISVTSGVGGSYYINGVSLGALTGVCTITSYSENLFIGNTNPAYTTINRNSPVINYALIFTRVLTATEHARVYAQLENMTWNTKGLTPGSMMP